MENTLECINSISFDIMNLYIECDNIKLCIPIIDGSVCIKILDIYKNNIGLNDLNINDSIKIYYKKNNNIIKPIKIIKLNNYIFNDESSPSDNEIYS